MVTGKRIRYHDAGVNIDEADRAVGAIKKMAQRTFTGGVLTKIGTFGACYALTGFKKPVLEVMWSTLPMLAILAIGVLLITYVPWLTLGLLHWMGRG